MGLPGGGLNAEAWAGPWGLTLDVSSYYVGLNVLKSGSQVPVDLADTTGQVGLFYQVPLDPTFQLAFGGAALYRQIYNVSGSLLSQFYASADKTYLGAGPALLFGWRAAPALALEGSVNAFPEMQTYNLPATSGQSGAKSVTRFGLIPKLTAQYTVYNNLFVTGGLTGLLDTGGGGDQSQVGVTLGFGGTF